MSIEFYPSVAKIKRNGVYENLPGFVPETHDVAVEQMIASGENTATAQYVHAIGSYFILNDTLYKAIANISVGDAIVVGTNCAVAVLGNDVAENREDIDGLIDDVDDITDAVAVLEPTATSSDAGKALIAKTVSGGKVTEYEFGEAGGGASAIVNSVENVPIASFDDGTASAVKQIVVGIEPVQSGSGDPAPDNVRPITGWTGAIIGNVDSFNTFDGVLEVGGISTSTGGDIAQTDRQRSKNFIPIKPQTTFYFYIDPSIAKTVFFYSANKSLISYRDLGTSNITFVTPSNAEFIRFIVRTTNAVNICINPNDAEKNGQFYPYGTGTTYSITFPTEAGTVYGGTLENHGTDEWKLRVDRAIVDLGTLTWGILDSVKAYATKSDMETTNNSMIYDIICSNYKSGSWDINNNIAHFNKVIRIHDDTFSEKSAEQVKSALSGIYAVYPLATPIEYTITAEAAKTLLGVNNIWADTGNINLLEYFADSKTYIDEQNTLVKALIAPVLDSMVADTALTANDFRIVNNTLYRITTPVASGGTLTPDTNCVATTITEVLKTLLT